MRGATRLTALLLALAPATQDSQAEFAREALAALAERDDELLRALASELPFRARLLAHELLWEALRAPPEDLRAREAARRIAAALGPEDEANAALAAAVRSAEEASPATRALQRELDRA